MTGRFCPSDCGCSRHENANQTRTLTLAERFAIKVEVRADGCHVWRGALNADGYGMFKVEGRTVLAHRFAFGFIPDGMTIDHICRTRACVRRDHLRVVTRSENARRLVEA